jgi:D-3-phosphoglycerate dehydrogenase
VYKVVITDLLKPVVPEEAILKENGATVVYGEAQAEDELIKLTQDADAIINVYAKMTPKVISALKKCQVIVRRGKGVDSVDIPAATAKGILVVNLPDLGNDEVADHTMAMLLCVLRKLMEANEHVKSGQWDFKRFLPIPGLQDCTLGLVGFGRIARAVAKRAKCFGLKLITHDPLITAEFAAEHGAELVSFEELLRTSDFVSVHCPLNEETRHLFSTRQFELMKPTAMLINTSRGPVIDEEALVAALQNKRIAFAALDVMTKEPPDPDNPLLKMDNVILTPHLAGWSDHAARVAGETAAAEIVRIFKGYLPKSVVNPNVIKARPDLKRAD